MKKIVLFIATIISVATYAQKNSILVAGNTGYTFANSGLGTASQQSYSFNPTIGYQFHDNWTIAGQGEMQFFEGINSSNNYGIGPLVRYSKKVSDMFSLFADINATYKWNNSAAGARGWDFGVKPLAFVNIHNNFGLTFSFGRLGYNVFGTDGAMENTFEASFGKTIEVGIQKNFGLK